MSIKHSYVSPALPTADPNKVGSVEWNAEHLVSISDTDIAADAAIAESKLNLTHATHAAVTLGTANGLELTGQELSLGLASATDTGVLSSSDWAAFNGKLDEAPGDGTTYGRKDGAWEAIGANSVDSVNGQTGSVVLDAEDIGVTAIGGIQSTDVQAALYELDSEKAPASHNHTVNYITDLFNDAEGDPAPIGTAADGSSSYAARRNHVHAASASSIANTPAGGISATNVQAALNELDTEKSSTSHTHEVDQRADMFNDAEGDPAAVGTTADGVSTYSARRDHVHSASASAIVNTPAGGISATDVQAALNELDTEKSSTSHTHEVDQRADMFNDAEGDPAAVGTAADGTSTYSARRDHVHGPGKLDDNAAPDDNTDLNASTTAHGLLLKATAPASGVRNVVAIDNGETAYKNTALVDSTNPAAIGTAAPGTQLVAARRDHVHAAAAGNVSFTPYGKISATDVQAAIQALDGLFESGTYTPTLTNGTNCAASTLNADFMYIRVGTFVVVSGSVQIDPTAAGNCDLDVSLPIASNLATSYDLNGNMTARGQYPGSVIANTTDDRATLTHTAVDGTNRFWRLMFQYRIL